MGAYYDEAKNYSDNANKIIELLDDALKESKAIDALLDENIGKYDYVTNKVSVGNNEIKKRINAIQEKLDYVSNTLRKEGQAIDDRIAEEEARKKEEEERKRKEEEEKEEKNKISDTAEGNEVKKKKNETLYTM